MSRLFIFNPDTDFAKGTSNCNFVPKRNVISLRENLSLIPVLLGDKNDVVAILSETFLPNKLNLQLAEFASKQGINIVPLREAVDKFNDYHLSPWGWDFTIASKFSQLGFPSSSIPSNEKLEKIRTLSHRSTALNLLKLICETLNYNFPFSIIEVNDIEEIYRFKSSFNNFWLKTPWSSSGRGILRSEDSSDEKIRQWAHSVLRKQGSIMIEQFQPHKLDFASEWFCKNGNASFIGFAISHISTRGKYHGNLILPQRELVDIIQQAININVSDLINAQKICLQKVIAPFYNGPLGIDMMALNDKVVNPCVECNIRYTMGHIAINASEKLPNLSFPESL